MLQRGYGHVMFGGHGTISDLCLLQCYVCYATLPDTHHETLVLTRFEEISPNQSRQGKAGRN